MIQEINKAPLKFVHFHFKWGAPDGRWAWSSCLCWCLCAGPDLLYQTVLCFMTSKANSCSKSVCYIIPKICFKVYGTRFLLQIICAKNNKHKQNKTKKTNKHETSLVCQFVVCHHPCHNVCDSALKSKPQEPVRYIVWKKKLPWYIQLCNTCQ